MASISEIPQVQWLPIFLLRHYSNLQFATFLDLFFPSLFLGP
jgi:hypothetical protein